MKLFNMKLYHGSPHDFDRFDTDHIGSGEGAQVHGWGLYFAEDKDVVKERYGERLGRKRSEFECTFDGKSYRIPKDTEEYQHMIDLGVPTYLAFICENYIDAWEDVLERNYITYSSKNPDDICYFNIYGSITFRELVKHISEAKRFVTEHDFYYGKVIPKSTIFTIEVPDSLKFIDETDSVPISLIHKFGITNKELKDKLGEEIYQIIKPYNDGKYAPNVANNIAISLVNFWSYQEDWYYIIKEQLNRYGSDWTSLDKKAISAIIEHSKNVDLSRVFPTAMFDEFYEKLSKALGGPKEASLALEQNGINGITYFGQTDGRCYVIFNPNNINIVEKE